VVVEEEEVEEEEEDLHHLLMSPSPSARSTASSLADIMGEFSLDSNSGNNTPKAAPPTPSVGKGALKFVQVSLKPHYGCLSILRPAKSHITSHLITATNRVCMRLSASSNPPSFTCDYCFQTDMPMDKERQATEEATSKGVSDFIDKFSRSFTSAQPDSVEATTVHLAREEMLRMSSFISAYKGVEASLESDVVL
jgi:hypothetical protein